MKTPKWYVIIGLRKSTVIFRFPSGTYNWGGGGGEQVSICVQSVWQARTSVVLVSPSKIWLVTI